MFNCFGLFCLSWYAGFLWPLPLCTKHGICWLDCGWTRQNRMDGLMDVVNREINTSLLLSQHYHLSIYHGLSRWNRWLLFCKLVALQQYAHVLYLVDLLIKSINLSCLINWCFEYITWLPICKHRPHYKIQIPDVLTIRSNLRISQNNCITLSDCRAHFPGFLSVRYSHPSLLECAGAPSLKHSSS